MAAATKTKITSVAFPKDVHAKLKERAKAEGFENSLSSYLVKLVRKALADPER